MKNKFMLKFKYMLPVYGIVVQEIRTAYIEINGML